MSWVNNSAMKWDHRLLQTGRNLQVNDVVDQRTYFCTRICNVWQLSRAIWRVCTVSFLIILPNILNETTKINLVCFYFTFYSKMSTTNNELLHCQEYLSFRSSIPLRRLVVDSDASKVFYLIDWFSIVMFWHVASIGRVGKYTTRAHDASKHPWFVFLRPVVRPTSSSSRCLLSTPRAFES